MAAPSPQPGISCLDPCSCLFSRILATSPSSLFKTLWPKIFLRHHSDSVAHPLPLKWLPWLPSCFYIAFSLLVFPVKSLHGSGPADTPAFASTYVPHAHTSVLARVFQLIAPWGFLIPLATPHLFPPRSALKCTKQPCYRKVRWTL